MTEWGRIEQRVKNATDDQITTWQDALDGRLFDCGFQGDRDEFLRLLSNAYLKFPQYHEAICEEIGVQADAAIARKRQFVNLVLTIVVVIISITTLVLTLCGKD